MQRVLSIVPYAYLPWFSGGQKLIGLFNEHLARHCTLQVAGTGYNDGSRAIGYTLHPVIRSGKIRYADITAFWRLKRLLRQYQADTLLLEHPFLGWLGVWLQHRTGIRLLVHTHNVEYQRFRSIGKWWWPLLKRYEGWVLRRARYVLCISEEDRQQIIQTLGVKAEQCVLVPYGVMQVAPPADKAATKAAVCEQYGLDTDKPLLFFNGLLDYAPNTQALQIILEQLVPRLQQQMPAYQVLVAGRRLPERFQNLFPWNSKHVFYAGFVDDIDAVTRAADVLLNPVLTGGGVKTKLLEAIANNTTVVATESGATGANISVCGEKLYVVPDGDWDAFVTAVKKACATTATTPAAFYDTYSWPHIAAKVAAL
jgi:glycosyltransferase involved in cell wall biosynthesis